MYSLKSRNHDPKLLAWLHRSRFIKLVMQNRTQNKNLRKVLSCLSSEEDYGLLNRINRLYRQQSSVTSCFSERQRVKDIMRELSDKTSQSSGKHQEMYMHIHPSHQVWEEHPKFSIPWPGIGKEEDTMMTFSDLRWIWWKGMLKCLYLLWFHGTIVSCRSRSRTDQLFIWVFLIQFKPQSSTKLFYWAREISPWPNEIFLTNPDLTI